MGQGYMKSSDPKLERPNKPGREPAACRKGPVTRHKESAFILRVPEHQ